MKKKLFQYAALYHEQVINGNTVTIETKIALKPDYILAENIDVATMKVHKLIPDQYLDHMGDMEVIVRPF